MRSWWKESRIWGLPGRRTTFLYFGVWMAFTFVYSWLNFLHAAPPALVQAWSFIFAYLSVRHTYGQFYGICRIYDYKLIEACGSSAAPSRTHSALQRAVLVLVATCEIFRVSFLVAQKFPTLLLPLSFGQAAFALIYLVTISREPFWRKSNKFIYALRLLVFAFSSLNWFSFCAILALHGLEFAFLSLEMFQNSKGSRELSIGWRAWSIFFVLIGGVVILAQFRPFMFGPDAINRFGWLALPILALASVSEALSYTHFFVDRYMFRFSEPVTREYVLPLIFPAATPADSSLHPSTQVARVGP